jgi:hypothetical protein
VHQGFAQTVIVCAINLLIFGIFLRFGGKDKVSTILLAGLLALTGIMLLSGFVRMKFYIEACGLTWLRILCAWFILWMAAVIVVCAVRLVYQKLPAIFISALLLLIFYICLGYANPDAIADWYNERRVYEVIPWTTIR